MDDFMNDSDLHTIISEATNVIQSIKESKIHDPLDLMERVRKVEGATDAYVSRRKNGRHFLNDEVNRIKSRIEVNKELLRNTLSNVSAIRSKLADKSPFRTAPLSTEFFTDATKENIDEKLNMMNTKIQKAIKDLTHQVRSGSKLEKMLRKYQGILNETTCLFKSVPNLLQQADGPRDKIGQRKLYETDRRAENMLRAIPKLPAVDLEPPELPVTEEAPEMGLGGWIHYEGFDTQDELERFKSLYRKVTGLDPDEDNREGITMEVIDDETAENTDTDYMAFIENVFTELNQKTSSCDYKLNFTEQDLTTAMEDSNKC